MIGFPALSDTMSSMSSKLKLLLVGVVVVAVAVGAGLWWFLKDDAPEEANLDDSVAAVQEEADAAGDSDDDDGAAAVDGVEGTWTVDTESGDFSFEDSASATYVGFRIQEVLSSIGEATAVGRTPEVTGEITIEGTTLTAATFTADMTAITTNESRRDDRVQSALETSQFPEASFALTEPVDLGAAAADGGPVSVTAVGELTVHGITQAVEISLDARLVEGTIVVVGRTEIVFADYDVAVPSAPVVVSAEDHGILEVNLRLTR